MSSITTRFLWSAPMTEILISWLWDAKDACDCIENETHNDLIGISVLIITILAKFTYIKLTRYGDGVWWLLIEFCLEFVFSLLDLNLMLFFRLRNSASLSHLFSASSFIASACSPFLSLKLESWYDINVKLLNYDRLVICSLNNLGPNNFLYLTWSSNQLLWVV